MTAGRFRCFTGGSRYCRTGRRFSGSVRSREAVLPAKKYAIWAAPAFVLLYVVKSPNGAAAGVRQAASGLADVADSLTVFVNKLASS